MRWCLFFLLDLLCLHPFPCSVGVYFSGSGCWQPHEARRGGHHEEDATGEAGTGGYEYRPLPRTGPGSSVLGTQRGEAAWDWSRGGAGGERGQEAAARNQAHAGPRQVRFQHCCSWEFCLCSSVWIRIRISKGLELLVGSVIIVRIRIQVRDGNFFLTSTLGTLYRCRIKLIP